MTRLLGRMRRRRYRITISTRRHTGTTGEHGFHSLINGSDERKAQLSW